MSFLAGYALPLLMVGGMAQLARARRIASHRAALCARARRRG